MGKVTRRIVQIDESRCNGCGLCIPRCAEGALRLVNGKAKLVADKYCDGLGACLGTCPRDAIKVHEREAEEFDEEAVESHLHGGLTRPGNWPLQLHLVNPDAGFFDGAEILLAADCVPASNPAEYGSLVKDRVVLIGCPKFDDWEAHLEKLTEILEKHDVKGVTVAQMEVPCCGGLYGIATRAAEASGKRIPVERLIIRIH